MHIKSGELLIRLIVVLTALLIIGGSVGCGDDSEVILKPIERTNSQQRADEFVPTTRSKFLESNRGLEEKVNPTNLLSGFTQKIFEAQVALARMGISSGSIDGLPGSQTRSAIRAFQEKEGLRATGNLDDATLEQLTLDTPALKTVMISPEDLTRLQPLGKTWLEKSQQTRLDYETVIESLAEKSQAHPNLIRKLNPGIDWEKVTAGTSAYVPSVQSPQAGKAAMVRIFLEARALEAFDENTNLIAHFPCSIAQKVEKRPVGELHVEVIAPNPNYTFNPDVFPESPEARELDRKLILQPGPNNPVGTVWIGLDKSGYGIHGTPRPEDVGRTESHGCFRLANWNAEFLSRLITVGTPVVVEP
jgi:lipoprotein-anchoring transpeptidase ErfK/SrfK